MIELSVVKYQLASISYQPSAKRDQPGDLNVSAF